jgi:catechol 2,3-dioxygenase-like lactoylglutathione lyase family enzyme
MIKGGKASIYVSDMDKAIHFYSEVLGLKLRSRTASSWAEIDAGGGLTIGLHPANPPETVTPGVEGSINLELNTTAPIETVVKALVEKGVRFEGPIASYPNVKIAKFRDPDSNIVVLAEVIATT